MLKNVSQNNPECIPAHLHTRKCTTGQEIIIRMPLSPLSRLLSRLTGLKLTSSKKLPTEASQIGLEIKQAVFGILFLTLLYSISRFLPLQMSESEENSGPI